MKGNKASSSTVEYQFKPLNDDGDYAGADSSENLVYNVNAEQSEPYIRGIANAPSEYFLAFFMLMSCGYMLPWTSLGSLITYYKATYSASFYVKLYCAYYLPGLPISLLQYKYDVYLDLKYGSQRTYLFRGMISYVVMMCILISLIWLKSRIALIILFILLGVCGWLCHGTASMLVSMYPPSAIAYLQTGFRCPEIYTIVAVSALHLGKSATIPNLNIFYALTSSMISIGAVSWAIVVMDKKSKDFFDIKDNRVYATDLSEAMPLLRNEKYGSSGNWQQEQRNNFVDKVTVDPQYEQQELLISDQNYYSSTVLSNNDTGMSEKEQLSEALCSEPIDGTLSAENSFSRFSSYASPIAHTRNLLRSVESAAMQLQLRPGDMYTMDDALFKKILPLCVALFVVMWCSIFQASFFAYVTSSKKGREIEQVLYFVRLFADLVGRPLTRLPRPSFLKVRINFIVGFLLKYSLLSCATCDQSFI